MKKWIMITIILWMMPISVYAQTQEFTYTKTGPTTVTGPIISRAHTYDSAPSAIQEGNIMKVWYCGGGAVGDPYHGHDSVYYTSFNATTGAPITPPQRVVWPSRNDAFDDGNLACAVTVIKHQNPYIANFSGVWGAPQYKMWYECAPRTYRKSDGGFQGSFNQICHAVSDDGITWRKYEALSTSSFRFNQQSSVVQNNPVKATAVITLPQVTKNNLQLERRADGKLYAYFGNGSGASDLVANYGVGHPTAIALPPDANGYQRIQLWYYDSQGNFNNRALMRVESGDGFHFETPVKTNLQSSNKIKYFNIPLGGHPGFYLSSAGGFYYNYFNYSWDGINWFWGDAGKGVDFYTNYLANNFNLGSVTSCPTFGNVITADSSGWVHSLTNIKLLSTEGGLGKWDNCTVAGGCTCYKPEEDDGRGNTWDIYTLTGNLTFIAPTPTPLLGDANGDGKVDGIDYVVWLTHYNQSVSGAVNGDFNTSGKVDGVDYVVWMTNYGR